MADFPDIFIVMKNSKPYALFDSKDEAEYMMFDWSKDYPEIKWHIANIKKDKVFFDADNWPEEF